MLLIVLLYFRQLPSLLSLHAYSPEKISQATDKKNPFFSEENSENKNVLVFNTSDNVIVQKYWKICLQLDLYHFLVHFIGVCSA